MRLGKHPLKDRNIKVIPPAKITVGVLSFIPETIGYHKDGLDILDLCLNSIRHNASHPFDLMVVDNGSCAEARIYLQKKLEDGLIDILILNQRNIGYLNGLLQILRSAPGNFIFYTDSDIYFKPGWMQAHLDIMENYPRVGLVGGIPIRNLSHYCTASTLDWAKSNANEVSLEIGDLIPANWLIEYYNSLGYFAGPWLDEFMKFPDYRVCRNNIKSFIGASHMQFLIRKEVAQNLPLGDGIEIAMASPETILDRVLDEKGYLRLSAAEPYVYHLGNALTEDWAIAEHQKYAATPAVKSNKIYNPSHSRKKHWFWGRSRVRGILRRLYEWAYDKYFEEAG